MAQTEITASVPVADSNQPQVDQSGQPLSKRELRAQKKAARKEVNPEARYQAKIKNETQNAGAAELNKAWGMVYGAIHGIAENALIEDSRTRRFEKALALNPGEFHSTEFYKIAAKNGLMPWNWNKYRELRERTEKDATKHESFKRLAGGTEDSIKRMIEGPATGPTKKLYQDLIVPRIQRVQEEAKLKSLGRQRKGEALTGTVDPKLDAQIQVANERLNNLRMRIEGETDGKTELKRIQDIIDANPAAFDGITPEEIQQSFDFIAQEMVKSKVDIAGFEYAAKLGPVDSPSNRTKFDAALEQYILSGKSPEQQAQLQHLQEVSKLNVLNNISYIYSGGLIVAGILGVSTPVGWAAIGIGLGITAITAIHKLRVDRAMRQIDAARGQVNIRAEKHVGSDQNFLTNAFSAGSNLMNVDWEKTGFDKDISISLKPGEFVNSVKGTWETLTDKDVRAALLTRVSIGAAGRAASFLLGALGHAVENTDLGQSAIHVTEVVQNAVGQGKDNVLHSIFGANGSHHDTLRALANCFIAGTLVLMADGTQKVIEEVEVGEKVYSYDEESQEIVIQTVEEIVTPVHEQMVVISFANGTKNTNTFDHPYFIKGKGWASFQPELTFKNYGLEVAGLIAGDKAFVYKDKKLEEVEVVIMQVISGTTQTYNLSKVSNTHTYFANGILVHNKFAGVNIVQGSQENPPWLPEQGPGAGSQWSLFNDAIDNKTPVIGAVGDALKDFGSFIHDKSGWGFENTGGGTPPTHEQLLQLKQEMTVKYSLPPQDVQFSPDGKTLQIDLPGHPPYDIAGPPTIQNGELVIPLTNNQVLEVPHFTGTQVSAHEFFGNHTGIPEQHSDAGNMNGYDHYQLPPGIIEHPGDVNDKILGTWQGAHTAYSADGKSVEFYGTYPGAKEFIKIDGHYYTFDPQKMTLHSSAEVTLTPVDGAPQVHMTQDSFLQMIGNGSSRNIEAGNIVNQTYHDWAQQHGITGTGTASDRLAQALDPAWLAKHPGFEQLLQKNLATKGLTTNDIHYTAIPMGEALKDGPNHITILAQNQYFNCVDSDQIHSTITIPGGGKGGWDWGSAQPVEGGNGGSDIANIPVIGPAYNYFLGNPGLAIAALVGGGALNVVVVNRTFKRDFGRAMYGEHPVKGFVLRNATWVALGIPLTIANPGLAATIAIGYAAPYVARGAIGAVQSVFFHGRNGSSGSSTQAQSAQPQQTNPPRNSRWPFNRGQRTQNQPLSLQVPQNPAWTNNYANIATPVLPAAQQVATARVGRNGQLPTKLMPPLAGALHNNANVPDADHLQNVNNAANAARQAGVAFRTGQNQSSESLVAEATRIATNAQGGLDLIDATNARAMAEIMLPGSQYTEDQRNFAADAIRRAAIANGVKNDASLSTDAAKLDAALARMRTEVDGDATATAPTAKQILPEVEALLRTFKGRQIDIYRAVEGIQNISKEALGVAKIETARSADRARNAPEVYVAQAFDAAYPRGSNSPPTPQEIAAFAKNIMEVFEANNHIGATPQARANTINRALLRKQAPPQIGARVAATIEPVPAGALPEEVRKAQLIAAARWIGYTNGRPNLRDMVLVGREMQDLLATNFQRDEFVAGMEQAVSQVAGGHALDMQPANEVLLDIALDNSGLSMGEKIKGHLNDSSSINQAGIGEMASTMIEVRRSLGADDADLRTAMSKYDFAELPVTARNALVDQFLADPRIVEPHGPWQDPESRAKTAFALVLPERTNPGPLTPDEIRTIVQVGDQLVADGNVGFVKYADIFAGELHLSDDNLVQIGQNLILYLGHRYPNMTDAERIESAFPFVWRTDADLPKRVKITNDIFDPTGSVHASMPNRPIADIMSMFRKVGITDKTQQAAYAGALVTPAQGQTVAYEVMSVLSPAGSSPDVVNQVVNGLLTAGRVNTEIEEAKNRLGF